MDKSCVAVNGAMMQVLSSDSFYLSHFSQLEAITSRRAASEVSPLANFALARPGQTGSCGFEFGALDSARTFWANTSSASEVS